MAKKNKKNKVITVSEIEAVQIKANELIGSAAISAALICQNMNDIMDNIESMAEESARIDLMVSDLIAKKAQFKESIDYNMELVRKLNKVYEEMKINVKDVKVEEDK